MPLSVLVLFEQRAHLVPGTGAPVCPDNPDLFQSFGSVRVEGSLLLGLSLAAHPHAQIETVFFVFPWNVAMAFPLPILVQQCIHVVPFVPSSVSFSSLDDFWRLRGFAGGNLGFVKDAGVASLTCLA